MNDFAVFILTHGRSDRVFTYNTLRKQGYTGKIYLIIDDEDKEGSNYKKLFKEQVIVFNKQEAINMTDSGDNFKKRNSVVYARNYAFKIAEDLGIKYFLVLDDDYKEFRYTFNDKKEYITKNILIKNLDRVIKIMLDFYKSTPFTSIAMSQGGDFIGGISAGLCQKYIKDKLPRKVMNSFFCSTDRPFKFMGRINEDVNAYVELATKGHLFMTYVPIRLEQMPTQSNAGGLTDIYLDLGTYVKSFYSVIYSPSCVKLVNMGVKNKRIHHKVLWKYTTPMILDEKYKK